MNTNKTFYSINKEIVNILNFIKNNYFAFDDRSIFKLITFKNLYTNVIAQDFLNLELLLKSLIPTLLWVKIRITYYINNWVYTTNHKRIAVNYFWFVILSGIVGMVLATLIRLEFAYPGVGIFAGDSIQYLSLATAHGVIMVFFMIMPLLFGAFANFLLPTQLGVHDVAFPRLNSAAFWFLPGGLLMLCQLVCVDRRYQRMNCFNIREIQSILKRKFFNDLINTHDHRQLLDKSIIGLRYRTGNADTLNSNILVFYTYGTEFTPKSRFLISSSSYKFQDLSIFSNFFFKSVAFFQASVFVNNINMFFINLNSHFSILNPLFGLFTQIYFFFLTSFDTFYLKLKFFFFNFIESISNFSTQLIVLNKLFLELSILFINFYTIFIDFILSSIKYFLFLDFINPSYIDINETFSLFFFKNSPFFGFFYQKPTLYCSFNTPLIWLNSVSILNNNFTFSRNNSTTYLPSNYYLPFSVNQVNDLNDHEYYYSFFRKSFFSNLDYSSRTVYIYFFFYFFLNLPFLLISFVKNSLDSEYFFFNLNKLYVYFTNWYVTFLFDNNLFEFLIDSNPASLFKSLQIQLYINLNNFFVKLKQMTAVSLFNESMVLILHLNELILNNLVTSVMGFLNFFIKTFIFIWFNAKTFSLTSYFLYEKSFSFNTIFNNSSLNAYSSNYFTLQDSNFISTYSNMESSNSFRYLKFNNPIFKYDYKSGDYFPKLYKEVYTSLFSTLSDLTGGLRTSPWFFSEKYKEAFDINFSNFITTYSKPFFSGNFDIRLTSITKYGPTDGFYNFFYLISTNDNVVNKNFVSLTSLNQKFYKMFNTSSMQQRVYSNWRQLKFTREAWRCKLLSARHQKTLFKKYVNEDGVFWSIERNAKDLLPGWAMITPFSSRTRFTAVGKTDIGLMGVLLVLNSSLISGANFLVTYRYLSTLNNRKMRDARAFFTEGIMVASWMMIAANPMLVIGIIMLLSDRHWQTSFFDYSGGGDTVLFQHMFWFFGHPEVYVIIIPTFGFTNTMLSYYLKKRVSARASLLYSMYTIAFLGFFVWGHHMYMVGLAHTTRMLFSTLTVMISVPAATKIMHWCVTTVNSSFATELPLLFTFTFIFFFVSGGISGMCVAHTGMDVLFHDTFYVIGHFHVMLAGAAMFGSFGAFYFYFPAIFGVKFSRIFAYLHYTYYLLGQLMTVIPMFWLGYAGMPRRVLDYPASMGGWHSVISAGHMLSVAGLMAFFIMIFDSLRQGRAVIRNTFGISRFNTRLNFYLYEIAKLTYVQQKALTFFRFTRITAIKLDNKNYFNLEPYETTLITYTFLKK